MKVLSIGNSFSQDAQRYLHEVALSNGVELETVNLYIGGCSLEMHNHNMQGDLPAYELERNGASTSEKISIRAALEMECWDVVTVQQVSNLSGDYSTYLPYITDLVAYVKTFCPQAKIYIHETWPYEHESELLHNVGYTTSLEMYTALKSCYERAATAISADGAIHSGTAMMEAIRRGVKIHRDTFHASLGLGRYLLALVWYKTLTGQNVSKDSFDSFDEPVSETERKLAIEIANAVAVY